jgi:hypothetical protein
VVVYGGFFLLKNGGGGARRCLLVEQRNELRGTIDLFKRAPASSTGIISPLLQLQQKQQ